MECIQFTGKWISQTLTGKKKSQVVLDVGCEMLSSKVQNQHYEHKELFLTSSKEISIIRQWLHLPCVPYFEEYFCVIHVVLKLHETLYSNEVIFQSFSLICPVNMFNSITFIIRFYFAVFLKYYFHAFYRFVVSFGKKKIF